VRARSAEETYSLGALPLAMLIKLPKHSPEAESDQHALLPFLTFEDTIKFRRLDTCTMHVTPPTKTSRLSNYPPCSWVLGQLWSPALVTWTCGAQRLKALGFPPRRGVTGGVVTDSVDV
jgi:hypothetical protein